MELGISSPLTQTGACKFAKAWLVDTATIYKIGITRTGVMVTILAAGNVSVGGIMMALNQADVWSGLGLWTGMPMLFCGLICVVLRTRRPSSKVSPMSFLCLLAFLASLVSMTTTVISLVDPHKYFPHYIRDMETDILPLHVMLGILMTLAVPEVVASLWALFISTGYVCACLKHARANIFTIMVEDEPTDHVLTSDLDTELTAFNPSDPNVKGQTPGVLQIQTDWISYSNSHDNRDVASISR